MAIVSVPLAIGCIVLGVLLIALARVIADAFVVPGDRSGTTRFAGLGDSPLSRLYRWATAVLTGAVFLAVGIAELATH